MSSEMFFHRNPPTTDTARRILEEQKNKHDYTDPLTYLAKQLYEESIEGIHKISAKYDQGAERMTSKDIGERVKVEAQVDISRMIFSSMTPYLMETVDTGDFSMKTALSVIHMGIIGASVPHFAQPYISQEETISKDEWDRVVLSAQNDPTLASLFENKHDLPYIVQEFIRMNNTLNFPLSRLLSKTANEWRPLAEVTLEEFKKNSRHSGLVFEGRPGTNSEELQPGEIRTIDDLRKRGDFTTRELEMLEDLANRSSSKYE